MEIRRLRYFMVVAEELHFGRAAARLHISQPPLSHQIRQLEAELGVELFRRTTRQVQLTAAGAELRDRLGDILDVLDRAVEDLHDVQAGRAGKLTVGFVSSASYTVMPQAVRQFRHELPDVRLTLVPLTSGQQVDQLHDGTLDLGIVRGGDASMGLSFEQLYTEELVACLPSDHPLASAREATPAELARESMISFPSRDMPGFVAQLRSIFSDPVPFPKVTHRVVHQETALGFVAAGMGFTLLPESVSRFKPQAVSTISISSHPTTSMMIATRPDATPGRVSSVVFRTCLLAAAERARTTTAPPRRPVRIRGEAGQVSSRVAVADELGDIAVPSRLRIDDGVEDGADRGDEGPVLQLGCCRDVCDKLSVLDPGVRTRQRARVFHCGQSPSEPTSGDGTATTRCRPCNTERCSPVVT